MLQTREGSHGIGPSPLDIAVGKPHQDVRGPVVGNDLVRIEVFVRGAGVAEPDRIGPIQKVREVPVMTSRIPLVLG